MIKAVIFDMDGLIVDTEVIESQAIIKKLKNPGKEPQIKPAGLVHEIGLGRELYEMLKDHYHLDTRIDELKKRKQAYFEKIIQKSKLYLFEGVFELLKKLKENNFKIALASNRNIHHINIILKELSIFDYFKFIVGPSETRRQKPQPDIYIETARQLNPETKYCPALEDTESGVRAASAAGMKVIAVPNDYSKAHIFQKRI